MENMKAFSSHRALPSFLPSFRFLCIQAASVVALRFNRHHNLRRALGRMGFMTRGQPVALCPMLEQEVAGYNLLLQTLVVLSRGMDVDSGEPVEGGAGWPFAQVKERERKGGECILLL